MALLHQFSCKVSLISQSKGVLDVFFLKFKTTVLSNNRFAKYSFLKKPLFQKRWSCDFPPRKTRLPKSTARFPAKKRWHSSPPVGVSWDFSPPPPPPESVRTDVRGRHNQNFSGFRINFFKSDFSVYYFVFVYS